MDDRPPALPEPTRSRRALRWARRGALALAAWAGLHCAGVLIVGLLLERPHPADVAVVLGNRVRPDGRPSPHLRHRLERALALYEQGLVRNLLVSGALGREGHQEADVMAEWLIARGVPPARVARDPQGWTTLATAHNARRILAERGWRSAVVVSQYYHLPRCRLAFWRCGVPLAGAAAARFRPGRREPYALLREWVGFYVYLVRPLPSGG